MNTLLTALDVKIDDELKAPRWTGRPPLLTDSELVCVAVAQSLLGFTSEAHWLRYARKHLPWPTRRSASARCWPRCSKSTRTWRPSTTAEDHGGRPFAGVAVRVAQRILAMAAAIWHNNATNAPITRSLTAYDH